MAWKKTDDINYSNIADKLRVQKPNQTFLPSEMDDAVDDINSDIADAYTACQSKGATLPQSQISGNLAQTVTNIPEKNTLDEYLANTLEVANIPSATSVSNSFFKNKTNLTAVIMPNVTNIYQSAFENCTNLVLTTFPNNINNIYAYAFANCIGIPYIDVSKLNRIPNLISWYAFNGTTFPFYFRGQQQLNEWAAATNWSNLTSRFQIKPSGVI